MTIPCLPTYYFSLFKAPPKIIDTLESKRRRFLWGGEENSKGINWVSWDTVTKLKSMGGFGLTPLKEANLAILSKCWWRFKTEEGNLW